MKRNLLFGDPAQMGSIEDVERDIRTFEKETLELEARDQEFKEDQEFQKKMSKRGTRGVKAV